MAKYTATIAEDARQRIQVLPGRPQVTQAVAEAAAMGDRSENAEYIYGKKQLRQIIYHRVRQKDTSPICRA